MMEERFFELFYNELEQNPNLYPYYKLNKDDQRQQAFRKAYFTQRLSFINKNINKDKPVKIFDCGCGYGTTAFFLAINGISTYGITLEFYYKEIENRRKYWENYGCNTSLFRCDYNNLFDTDIEANSLDYIILQDTLHHLEPVKDSLNLFYKFLKPGGKLILVEENGNSLPQSFKLYLQRGNKRVIDYYDETLGKNVPMGNENIRSQKKWRALFNEVGFKIDETKTEYIRLLPPIFYNEKNISQIIKKENSISKFLPLIKEYGYFGLNMVFHKKE